MKLFFKNYLSTNTFILLLYFFYSSIEYYQNFFRGTYMLDFMPWMHFTAHQAFLGIIGLYLVALIPFYLIEKEKSKALLCVEAVWKKAKNFSYKLSHEEKTAILAWWVKWFFAPLMIYWMIWHIFSLVSSIGIFALAKPQSTFLELFNTHIFWISFNTIFFVDVLFFTLWYLVESPYLKNTIKSVEPTILWWVVALCCYPPFNDYTWTLLWWYSTDFPQFASTYIHLFFNICILVLMAVYSWASFSLWLKASNLTNRGIITTWPYRYIRHPAYVAKNLAWWIGAFPMILISMHTQDYRLLSLVLVSLICWSWIYTLRAFTEEWHLSKDKDYREYKKIVPYRFIPKIW